MFEVQDFQIDTRYLHRIFGTPKHIPSSLIRWLMGERNEYPALAESGTGFIIG